MKIAKIKRMFFKFVCVFIWSRGLRCAIRDGYFLHYLKMKKIIKQDMLLEKGRVFPHQLCFVAIVKQEAAYLPEWIEYHRLVGVEKFFIYDNESTDDVLKTLDPYIKSGVVEYKLWPGKAQQVPAYNDAIVNHKYDTKWMGFIDIDEFVVPISTKTITELLKSEFESENGLAINWLMYGDSGLKKREQELVIKRFTKHALYDFEVNRNVKSIVNPRTVLKMLIHHAYFIGNKTIVNSNKKQIKKGWRINPIFDKIRVNHYWGKTWEEFKIKKFRGDACTGDQTPRSDEMYDYHNRNDIEDKIMEKYVKRVNAILK